MNFGDRVAPRDPARHATEHLHGVTGNDARPLALPYQALDLTIRVQEIPAIALMVARWPHALDIGERSDRVPGHHIGTVRRAHLDPLRSERVGVCGKTQPNARADLV